MRQLLTLTVADLRQRVRDRTVLIFGLLIPLGLISVFNLVLGDSQEVELETVTVVASTAPGDPVGDALLGTLEQLRNPEVRLEQVSADKVGSLVEDGEAELGIVVPEGFSESLRAGSGATVQAIEGENAGLESDVLIAVTQGVLDRFHAGAVAATAASGLEVDEAELEELSGTASTGGPGIKLVAGQAATEQLPPAAALVAGQAGLFLLFTVGFGVLALLAEREQGTLARLQSMPLPLSRIVLAKALSAFILGVTATTVLLAIGSVMFEVHFGSPVAVAVMVLCAVAAATSLTFVVVRLARTAEQAQMVQSIVAMVLGLTGGAFFPIAASGFLGTLLNLNPVAAFTRGLGITAGGGNLGDIGVQVLILLAFAAVCVLASRLVPDRGAPR